MGNATFLSRQIQMMGVAAEVGVDLEVPIRPRRQEVQQFREPASWSSHSSDEDECSDSNELLVKEIFEKEDQAIFIKATIEDDLPLANTVPY